MVYLVARPADGCARIPVEGPQSGRGDRRRLGARLRDQRRTRQRAGARILGLNE